MNISNMSHLFQKNNLLGGSNLLQRNANAPANALQKISNQMIAEQENSNKETDQIKLQLRMDTFTKGIDSSDVERAKMLLRFRHHNISMHDRTVELRENDLVEFKERLQKLDKEIQSYQDILDDKSASLDELTSMGLKGSLDLAKQARENLIAAGLESFTDTGEDFVSDYNELATHYFGQASLSDSHISNWRMDFSAPDIYAEIDRALASTREVRGVIHQDLTQISNMIKAYDKGYDMGYTADLQGEQPSPYKPRFGLDAYDIREEIERLKNGPMFNATRKMEEFINPLEK